ncbi:MAG: hypothetical protein U0169_18050 [Polyangiaceae bacterium]
MTTRFPTVRRLVRVLPFVAISAVATVSACSERAERIEREEQLRAEDERVYFTPGAFRAGEIPTGVPCPYCGPGLPLSHLVARGDLLDEHVNLSTGGVSVDGIFYRYSTTPLVDHNGNRIASRSGAGGLFWNKSHGFMWKTDDEHLIFVTAGATEVIHCVRSGTDEFVSTDHEARLKIKFENGGAKATAFQTDGSRIVFARSNEAKRYQQVMDQNKDQVPLRRYEYLDSGQLHRVFTYTNSNPPAERPTPELEFKYRDYCVFDTHPAADTRCVPGQNGRFEKIIDSIAVAGVGDVLVNVGTSATQQLKATDRPYVMDDWVVRTIKYPGAKDFPYMEFYYYTNPPAPTLVPKRNLIREVHMSSESRAVPQNKRKEKIWSFGFDADNNRAASVSMPTRFEANIQYVDADPNADIAGWPEHKSRNMRVVLSYKQSGSDYRRQVHYFDTVRPANALSDIAFGGLDSRTVASSRLLDLDTSIPLTLAEVLALPSEKRSLFHVIEYKAPLKPAPTAPAVDKNFSSKLPVRETGVDLEEFDWTVDSNGPRLTKYMDDGPADDPIVGDFTADITYDTNPETNLPRVRGFREDLGGLPTGIDVTYGASDPSRPVAVEERVAGNVVPYVVANVQRNLVCMPLTVPVEVTIPLNPGPGEDDAGAPDGGTDAGDDDGGDATVNDSGSSDGGDAGDDDGGDAGGEDGGDGGDAGDGSASDGGSDGGGGMGPMGGGTLVASVVTPVCVANTNVSYSLYGQAQRKAARDGFGRGTSVSGQYGTATATYAAAGAVGSPPEKEQVDLPSGAKIETSRVVDPLSGLVSRVTDNLGFTLNRPVDAEGSYSQVSVVGPDGVERTLKTSFTDDEIARERTTMVEDNLGISSAYASTSKVTVDRCERPVKQVTVVDGTPYKTWEADYPACLVPKAECTDIPEIRVRSTQYESSFFCEENCSWVQYCYCAVPNLIFPFIPPCEGWTYTLISSPGPNGRLCEAEAKQKGLLQECLRRR